jgi:hypothetical protein
LEGALDFIEVDYTEVGEMYIRIIDSSSLD